MQSHIIKLYALDTFSQFAVETHHFQWVIHGTRRGPVGFAALPWSVRSASEVLQQARISCEINYLETMSVRFEKHQDGICSL